MASSSSADEDDDESAFQSHYNGSPSSSSSSSSSPSPSPSPPPLIHHNFFAPPFYNRPPTPLPPSPSLTSLLRPSRPTTPDASDNDDFEPVPRASPKVPTYEYYGFVLYLFSSLAFLMYILWSYLPSPFLHALGIHYYPNRWWSLAIPAWLVVLIMYIYVALAAYNTGYLTLPMSSIETIIDEAANVATLDGKGSLKKSNADKVAPEKTKEGKRRKEEKLERKRLKNLMQEKDWKAVWSVGTDACLDVPLGGVCEVLYGDDREMDPEDVWLDGPDVGHDG